MRALLLGCVTLGLGAQTFTQEARVPVQAPRSTVLYDLRDLLTVMDPSPLPPGEKLKLLEARNADAPAAPAETTLLGLIRAFAPSSVTADQINASRWALVTTLDQAQHDWLRNLVERQRQQLTSQVEFRVWLLTVRPEALAELRPGGESLVLPTVAERDAFLARATAAGAESLALPAVRTQPLALAQVELLEKIAYVKDYEICMNVQPGGQTIVDPKIDYVRDGVELAAHALLLEDDVVGFDLRVREHDLVKPIPAFKTRVGDHDVEIGLPTTKLTSLHATLKVARGQSVVFRPPEHRGKVKVVVVTLEDLHRPAK